MSKDNLPPSMFDLSEQEKIGKGLLPIKLAAFSLAAAGALVNETLQKADPTGGEHTVQEWIQLVINANKPVL